MSDYQKVQVNNPTAGEIEPVSQTPDHGDDAPNQPSAGAVEQAPTWLPSKFKTPEELAKAYTELEKRLSGPAKLTKTGDAPAGESETPAGTETPASGAITTNELESFEQEYAQSGALSENSYKALEKKGLPKHVVDNYIQGQMRVAEAQVNQVFEAVGGQESYGQMVEWARTNMTAEERAAYDSAVDSKDMGRALFAARGLHARFTQAQGSAPKLIAGKASGDPAAKSFRSTGEMSAAMNDPRYRTDEAYRMDVMERLRNSNIL